MKIVGAFEAKTYLSRLLEEVDKNKTQYLIRKRGKNVALLVPYGDKGEKTPEAAQEIIQGVRKIRKSLKKKITRKEINSLINTGR